MIIFNKLFSFFFFIETSNIDLNDNNLNNVELYNNSLLLLQFISYFYIFIKIYKILCYAKMTSDWFPMLNPYQWPFSFFQAVATPYFRFCAWLLPSLKFKKSSIEISGIVGLEALNAVIYLCVRMANFLVEILESI